MTWASALGAAQLGAAVVYGAVTALRVVAVRRRLRKEPEARTLLGPNRQDWSNAPLVTVVQPILGGDPALRHVLSETLARTPAWAVFLWLVDDDDPVGATVASELAAADPRVDVVRCPPPAREENPKVKKLAAALPRVTTPFLAVLDDDTVIGEANLAAALDVLGHGGVARAELYTGLPSYDQAPGSAGGLLAHFVDDHAPSTYLALQGLFGALSLNGMFYVARTEDLRRIDAFEAIVGELCDDYALARRARSHGWRIHQGHTALRLTTTLDSLAAYTRQMHRWFVFALVLLDDQPLGRRAALGLCLGVPPLLLAVVVAGGVTGWRGALVAAVVLALRQLALWSIRRRVLGTRPGPPPRQDPLLSIVGELLQPLHAVHARCVSTVRWRSRRIVVGRDGRYREVAAEVR